MLLHINQVKVLLQSSLGNLLGDTWTNGIEMLMQSRNAALPQPWAHGDKLAMVSAKKALANVPVTVLVVLVMGFVPYIIWLRHALMPVVPAMILEVYCIVQHNMLNAVTFEFKAIYHDATQRRFVHKLTTGEFAYDEAIAAYSKVNTARKAVANGLMTSAGPFWVLWFCPQAVLLYDAELRPWGGWPLGVVFVTNILTVLLILNQFVGLNDWPDELSAGVMESAELAWSPTERSNFVAHVAATRVHVQLFGFEMSAGFRTALPLVFLGWWLYITELMQFHSFTGFPFDQVCANFTASEGEGHHH